MIRLASRGISTNTTTVPTDGNADCTGTPSAWTYSDRYIRAPKNHAPINSQNGHQVEDVTSATATHPLPAVMSRAQSVV
jgi:hypothetical protein